MLLWPAQGERPATVLLWPAQGERIGQTSVVAAGRPESEIAECRSQGLGEIISDVDLEECRKYMCPVFH